MYKIYDSVSYGYGEPLVPFTLIEKLTTLEEVLKYITNNNNKNIKYFIFDENNNEIKI
jgi:hypothetical protein